MGLRIQILLSIGSFGFIFFFSTYVLVGKHHKNKSSVGKAAQRRTRGTLETTEQRDHFKTPASILNGGWDQRRQNDLA
jgi:hypothetical protein